MTKRLSDKLDEVLPQDAEAQYFRDISEYELLTPKQENECSQKIQGDYPEEEKKAAVDLLVCSNLKLVYKIAREFSNKGVSFLDLKSEGNMGLIRATETFDPAKGAKFSTYAVWWIKQAMRKGIAAQSRTIRVPIQSAAKISKIRKVQIKFYDENGRDITIPELSAATEMTENTLEGLLHSAYRDTTSMNRPIVNGEKGEMGDFIVDGNNRPDEEVSRGDRRKYLLSSIEQLTEVQQIVLNSRYGLGGGDKMTLEDVGEVIGKTRERVRQIQNKAESRLKEIMGDGVDREATDRYYDGKDTEVEAARIEAIREDVRRSKIRPVCEGGQEKRGRGRESKFEGSRDFINSLYETSGHNASEAARLFKEKTGGDINSPAVFKYWKDAGLKPKGRINRKGGGKFSKYRGLINSLYETSGQNSLAASRLFEKETGVSISHATVGNFWRDPALGVGELVTSRFEEQREFINSLHKSTGGNISEAVRLFTEKEGRDITRKTISRYWAAGGMKCKMGPMFGSGKFSQHKDLIYSLYDLSQGSIPAAVRLFKEKTGKSIDRTTLSKHWKNNKLKPQSVSEAGKYSKHKGLICSLHEESNYNGAAAARLFKDKTGMEISNVSILYHWGNAGLKANKPGLARKDNKFEKYKDFICSLYESSGGSATNAIRQFKEKIGIDISATSIHRWWNKGGITIDSRKNMSLEEYLDESLPEQFKINNPEYKMKITPEYVWGVIDNELGDFISEGKRNVFRYIFNPDEKLTTSEIREKIGGKTRQYICKVKRNVLNILANYIQSGVVPQREPRRGRVIGSKNKTLPKQREARF